jgi:chromosome segregation ATPase
MPAIVLGKPKPNEQKPEPGQKPEAKGLTFGAPKPHEEQKSKVSEDMAELTRRLRTIEERYNTMQTKSQFIEHNMLSYHKQALGETKTLNSDVREVKRELAEIKDKILALIKEIQLSAKKDEIKILERYINMWEPVNFVTRNEVADIIKEILEERK